MFLPTKLAVFTQIRRVSTEVPPNSPPYHRKDCTTYPDGSAATLSRMGHRRSFAQHQRRISHAIGPGQTQEYFESPSTIAAHLSDVTANLIRLSSIAINFI